LKFFVDLDVEVILVVVAKEEILDLFLEEEVDQEATAKEKSADQTAEKEDHPDQIAEKDPEEITTTRMTALTNEADAQNPQKERKMTTNHRRTTKTKG